MAFLSPEAAGRREEPGWRVASPYEPRPGPLLDPCGSRQVPHADQVEASAERELYREAEESSAIVTQEVFRYASAMAAEAAFADYLEAVRRCPTKPDPQAPEQYTRYDAVQVAEPGSGVSRVLVRARSCNPACTDLHTGYLAVQQAGDGVMTLTYGIGSDGDPGEGARAILDAAAGEFEAAVRPS